MVGWLMMLGLMSSNLAMADEFPLPVPGAGPVFQSSIDVRRTYAPPQEGNPPPRVDDPRVRFDSFLPANDLWNRIRVCDGVAIVGLKKPDRNRGYYLGQSYVTAADLKDARTAVSSVNAVTDATAEFYPAGEVVDWNKVVRPQMIVRIEDVQAIDALRGSPHVDYLEPRCMNDFQLFSSVGCGGSLLNIPDDEAGADAREKSIVERNGEVVPWSFRELGLLTAWSYLGRKGLSRGAGASVGVVDTGISETEPEFWTEFSVAKGAAPMLDWAAPFYDNAWDKCNHGTRMAAFATAPDTGNLMVGVARDSALLVMKIGDGVFHAMPGREEIGFAIERAADRSQVVTLAWGMPFGSQAITESIHTVMQNTETVLVAAAGTLLPFGISVFPATLENETISVSAIAPRRGTPTEFVRLPPAQVSYNRGVDILGVTSVDNEAGPTVGLDNGQLTSFGGSSAATAQLAGIFALAASSFQETHPLQTLSREALTNRVLSYAFQRDRIPGETFTNGRSDEVGLGLVNSYAAVGGFMGLAVLGDRYPPPGQPFTLTAETVGDGPFTYQWRVVGTDWTVISTSQTATLVLPPGVTSREYSATVTEAGTGHTRTAYATVFGQPSHQRVLYSRDMVASWATFFDGHKIARVLNEDQGTRAGCSVRQVLGQEYVRGPAGGLVPFGVPVQEADRGDRGFTVLRPSGWLGNQQSIPPEGLSVYVHAWHDGLSAVWVRPVYVFDEPFGVDCMTGLLQDTP